MDAVMLDKRPVKAASLVWSDRYSIGVPEIDADHRNLFELVGAFLDFPDPVPPDIVNLLLRALVEYTAMHFEREEAYQEEIGYPGLAAHRAEHAGFVRHLSALQLAFAMAPRQIDVHALRRLVRDWLVGHVMHSDVEIGRFAGGRAGEG